MEWPWCTVWSGNDPTRGVCSGVLITGECHSTADVRDNPHLAPEHVERIERQFVGTAREEQALSGGFTSARGLVYAGFTHDHHVIDAEEAADHNTVRKYHRIKDRTPEYAEDTLAPKIENLSGGKSLEEIDIDTLAATVSKEAFLADDEADETDETFGHLDDVEIALAKLQKADSFREYDADNRADELEAEVGQYL